MTGWPGDTPSQVRWVAARVKHFGIVVGLQHHQVGHMHRLRQMTVRLPQVRGDCDYSPARADHEADGANRVVRNGERRNLDIPEENGSSDVKYGGRGERLESGCPQHVVVRPQWNPVASGELSRRAKMIAMLVADENAPKSAGRNALGFEHLLQRCPTQSRVKEERDRIGPQEVRVSGAAAGQGSEVKHEPRDGSRCGLWPAPWPVEYDGTKLAGDSLWVGE